MLRFPETLALFEKHVCDKLTSSSLFSERKNWANHLRAMTLFGPDDILTAVGVLVFYNTQLPTTKLNPKTQ